MYDSNYKIKEKDLRFFEKKLRSYFTDLLETFLPKSKGGTGEYEKKMQQLQAIDQFFLHTTGPTILLGKRQQNALVRKNAQGKIFALYWREETATFQNVQILPLPSHPEGTPFEDWAIQSLKLSPLGRITQTRRKPTQSL